MATMKLVFGAQSSALIWKTKEMEKSGKKLAPEIFALSRWDEGKKRFDYFGGGGF